ncbi:MULTISPECIES: uroporphyrinogen-III synthase [unclassified Mycobacterium]|uniref:uroporphyrinogen-III synthase n=1 Tax=unclassified Mycobacterium TaxID=2642494 RepID=UPI0004000DD2|nr:MULTISPECIES: uroporphyrinogen-III synthase [unclassified Mycobacterium]
MSTSLSGYRVAVTSARRAEELCTLLRRHGASVCAAPAITMIDLTDDTVLHGRTESLIENPPDVLVVTTAMGLRGWIAAAEGWGIADRLIAALTTARVVARGPKAVGALRTAGLPEEWSPESESSAAMLDYLKSDIAGARVAVQLHGTTGDWDPAPELLDQFRKAGADVLPIPVYRWRPAQPGGEFDQLTSQIAQRQFDAVSFTSAAAVMATLTRAADLGISDALLLALRSDDVHAMCVGPLTARPLALLDIPTSSPRRMRLGALARHIIDELPRLRAHTVHAAGHRIEVRGNCVLVDGVAKPMSPSSMATLRALAHQPGRVVSRQTLLEALPGNGTSTHAVETAVLRLRTTLGDKNIVTTVVKRGYRLAVDQVDQVGQEAG